MSLVTQAQENNLPSVQFIDGETLEWIKNNKPNLPKAKSGNIFFVKELLQKYLPANSWFLKKDHINSIHGIRHIMRVIANIANITFNRGINTATTHNCLIAASLHDLRRIDDKGDEKHAKKAKEWFTSNCDKVLKYFNTKLSKGDIDKIGAAIYFHGVPYSEIGSDERYLKHKDIIDLVKTSDALDRYRLPKLKWWINESYLKLVPSDYEKFFAYNLVVESEEKYLLTKNSVKSVLDSLL